jgi:hypothetical protein
VLASIRWAAQAYAGAIGDIAADGWPKTDEEYFKNLSDLGLMQQRKYSWTRTDTSGTTTIDGDPRTAIVVKYEPHQERPLAPGVIELLRSATKSVRLVPPDELELTEDGNFGYATIETTVTVRMPSGSWISTVSKLAPVKR